MSQTTHAHDINEWTTAAHAQTYLDRGDVYPPQRVEGEAVLVAELPDRTERVLDLGCGDGRLLAVVLDARPDAHGVAVDFSETMLAAVRARFEGNPNVGIVAHDLAEPLPDLGSFDAIVSSFAIHHVTDERKRALYREVFERLRPGGFFANLEHVRSRSPRLRVRFWQEMGQDPDGEDPSNKLALVEVQLDWLDDIGFVDVDCLWRWRELALMVGTRP